MWPPPAPPDYIDHTQLPANLRPSSLVSQWQRGEEHQADADDVTRPPGDASTTDPARQRSSGCEAHLSSTATRPSADHVKTSQHDTGLHEEPRQHKDGDTEDHNQLRRSHSDMTHDKQPGHQLKRSSSHAEDDREHGIQAKRLSDVTVTEHTVTHPPTSPTCSHDVMDVDHPRSHAGEAGTRHQQVLGSETVSSSRDETEPYHRAARRADHAVTVPPRLMETGRSDDPMVIEFSAGMAGSAASNDDDVSVRAGHKRARVNSDNVLNDVVKQSFVKRPVTFYGPPVWLHTVDEEIYEPLGTSTSLLLPQDMALCEDSSTRDIGDWGEQLVNNYLQAVQAKPESGITSFDWANVDNGSGLPYDFTVTSADCEVTYVEVKATLSDHKACFEFSHRQLVFAGEHGARYHLYRVFCAGDPVRVRLVRVENLTKRLEERQLKLFMAI